MKFIPFREFRDPAPEGKPASEGRLRFATRAVIEAVAGGAAPQKVDEMRRRCRILDALDRAPVTGVVMEDADHAHLVKLVHAFQFGIAHRELLAIVDDILEARAPSPELKAVAAAEARSLN